MKRFTQRVFGLPSRSFFPVHQAALQAVRLTLVPDRLATHAASLANSLQNGLATWPKAGEVCCILSHCTAAMCCRSHAAYMC